MAFKCEKCNAELQRWTGKCPACNEWNSIKEYSKTKDSRAVSDGNIGDTYSFENPTANMQDGNGEDRIKFGSDELNVVLGGGLMPGSLILLSGEPGIGKSTITLQMANWFARNGQTALYFSCEENRHQVFARANRLGVNNKDIFFSRESKLENVIATAKNSPANLIVVDSISLLYSDDINGSNGSPSQVKYIADKFMDFVKTSGKSAILIGHVTKDGSISGPKTLEHLVDVVLFLEGEKYDNYRLLRTLKNRFGATDETGVFKMTEKGFEDVKNIGSEFMSQHAGNIAGSAFGVTMEGTRTLLVEIESLTQPSNYGYPKISAQGIPQKKTDQIIAVIGRFLKNEAQAYDVYAKIAHGFTVDEPGIDLAVIASIFSAMNKKPLGRTSFIGEVSLTGIVKPVSHLKKRIDESIKLGFNKIIVPKSGTDVSSYGDKVVEIEYVDTLPGIIGKL